MTTTIQLPHIASLSLLKEKAENVADRAKHVADSLRVEYARQLLQEAFPQYSLAVFGRTCDEDEPALIQLLSSDGCTPDLDLSKDAEDFSVLLPAQKKAVIDAERTIILIGHDDDILEHLDAGEEEHEGWIEFDLDLALNRSAG